MYTHAPALATDKVADVNYDSLLPSPWFSAVVPQVHEQCFVAV